MKPTREILMLFSAGVGFLVLLIGIGVVLVKSGFFPGVLLLFVAAFVYGWVLFSYLHYRHTRQEEFLHLLITAVESNVPLAPSLQAYVQDRPQGKAREVWAGTLFYLVLPGFYWVWYRERNFDRKVAAVAHLIEQGTPLYHALLVTPGVVSRETLLAVAMGEITGEMAECLRGAARSRVTTLWMEMLPRVVYPIIVLLLVLGIMSFWHVFIIPKMTRIFKDLGVPMPEITNQVIDFWEPLLNGVFLASLGVLLLGTILLFSSTARWYFPGLGRFYRMHVQGLVLKMLSALLKVGKPAPEALALLADSDYFSSAAEGRLDASRHLVQQGEPLAGSLYRGGLLPASMVPLVQAAERARNLPWALNELGESLSERTVRLIRRISLFVAPLLILTVGLLVGFIVLGMFVPLVEMLGKIEP